MPSVRTKMTTEAALLRQVCNQISGAGVGC